MYACGRVDVCCDVVDEDYEQEWAEDTALRYPGIDCAFFTLLSVDDYALSASHQEVFHPPALVAMDTNMLKLAHEELVRHLIKGFTEVENNCIGDTSSLHRSVEVSCGDKKLCFTRAFPAKAVLVVGEPSVFVKVLV